MSNAWLKCIIDDAEHNVRTAQVSAKYFPALYRQRQKMYAAMQIWGDFAIKTNGRTNPISWLHPATLYPALTV